MTLCKPLAMKPTHELIHVDPWPNPSAILDGLLNRNPLGVYIADVSDILGSRQSRISLACSSCSADRQGDTMR